MKKKASEAPGIQGLERAVSVVTVVATHAERGCRLADVIRETGLGRATAHRFMKGLERLGLIEFDLRTETYFPGIQLSAWGAAASNRFGLGTRAQPAMQRLAMRTSDTVYLMLRAGNEAVCLAREEGLFPIKTLTLRIGDRRPLGVGAGCLALLAFLPEEEIEWHLNHSAQAVTAFGLDSATIREMVETSRRAGYGLNDNRMMPGMSAVGVPICASDGLPVAAISVAAISSRMETQRRENIVAWIRDEVARIEAELAPLLGPMAAGWRGALLASKTGG